MNLILFCFGGYRLSTDCRHAAPLLELCLARSVEVRAMKNAADGGISFLCPALSGRRLAADCAALGIPVHRSSLLGLPGLFYRHRRRAGAFLGILLSCILLFLSRSFVWEVRVRGNRELSAWVIREALASAGLGVGDYIPGVDTREAENRLLLSCEELSWASVTLDGTVVTVQVIEGVEGAPALPAGRNPCNLVAGADGQIEYLELYRGDAAVKVGQAVKKGELLVSGVLDRTGNVYPFTRAAGQVYARTQETLTVEIPLSYTEKVYTREKETVTALKFFNFSLNFCKSTGNEGGTYDIIKVDQSFSFLGERALPLSCVRSIQRYYTEQARSRTREEAVALAYEALNRELGTLAADARILETDYALTLSEEAVILRCTVTCVRNIAVIQEFLVAD